MADQLQLRGGTTAEHATFTGALREVTVDTDKDTIVVHDNATVGGRPLLREDLSNLPAGTIDNADINASAAIAGTKVAPDFGSQNITTTGVFSHALGAVGTPSIAFTGDLNTGFWSPAADTLAASTGGSERLRIDSTGRLGLGTSSPTYLLDAQGGRGRVTANSETYSVGVRYSSALAPNGNYWIGATNAVSPDMVFSNNAGNEKMRLTDGGSLGIGTTTPGRTLSVDGAIQVSNPTSGFGLGNGLEILHEVDGETYFLNRRNSNMRFFTNNTERFRCDGSGRLLVGTSSASGWSSGAKVVVQDGSNASYQGITLGNSGDGTTDITLSAWSGSGGSVFVQKIRAITGGLAFLVSSASSADATGTPTEAMRINGGQELLIGYTSDNGAYKLQVNSQIFATSATVATSDGRYKENVASLGGCLDLVKALRPVSFTWKQQQDITRTDDEGNEVLVREGHNFPQGTQVGFIAQEVQEVLTDKPWLSSVIKENVRPAVLDSKGNELAPEEQFFGIAEGSLIAVLTNALQEAVAQIETLKDRVAALEAQ